MRPGDPRRKAAFGGRMRPPFGVRDPFLLNYADGTFARASAATWPLLPTVIREYVSGERRILDDDEYATEGARTNTIKGDSSRLDSTSWTAVLSASISSEAETSLFDGESADTLTFGAGADSGIQTDLLGTSDAQTVTAFVIASTTTGTKDFRLRLIKRDGTTATSGDLTATTTPQQFSFTAAIGTGVTQPEGHVVNAAAGGTGTVVIDHVQVEIGQFASSPIRSTEGAASTRLADSMVMSQADIDPRFSSGPWEVTVTPEFSSADLAASSLPFYVFRTGTTDYITFLNSGVVRVRMDSLNADYPGLAWDAGDDVTFKVHPSEGDSRIITPTQDQTKVSAGTMWTTGDMQVGQRPGTLDQPWFGVISRPFAIADIAA